MIQFNLLPDVKLQFIKARRVNHVVTLISIVVIAASLAALVFMFITVDVVQKAYLHRLNDDIAKSSKQLKATPDLDKILTVQNQLGTLTQLHDDKVVASRLFGFLSKVTPPQASISKISVDFVNGTMSFNGGAPSLIEVNKFTNTLKQTTFSTADETVKNKKAFSEVVLSSFSASANGKGSNYSITLKFKPEIFEGTSDVTINVPGNNSTDPATLFKLSTEVN